MESLTWPSSADPEAVEIQVLKKIKMEIINILRVVVRSGPAPILELAVEDERDLLGDKVR